MVNLLTGPKGTGKTQQMIEQANQQAKSCNGNVVFIKKTHRDTASVAFDIRTICMDDFPAIENIDEYIGFYMACTVPTMILNVYSSMEY